MSFEKYSNPKKEFSIHLKSLSVFRGPKYDSFYIIGSLDDNSNLIKFKYFSTKHNIFGHRGVFRVITKGEPTMDTYKKEPISCFIIDSIYPEHEHKSLKTPEIEDEKEYFAKRGCSMKNSSPKKHSSRSSYHPYIENHGVRERQYY